MIGKNILLTIEMLNDLRRLFVRMRILLNNPLPLRGVSFNTKGNLEFIL